MPVIQIIHGDLDTDLDTDLGEDMIKLLPLFGVNYQQERGALTVPISMSLDEVKALLDEAMPNWRDSYRVDLIIR